MGGLLAAENAFRRTARGRLFGIESMVCQPSYCCASVSSDAFGPNELPGPFVNCGMVWQHVAFGPDRHGWAGLAETWRNMQSLLFFPQDRLKVSLHTCVTYFAQICFSWRCMEIMRMKFSQDCKPHCMRVARYEQLHRLESCPP